MKSNKNDSNKRMLEAIDVLNKWTALLTKVIQPDEFERDYSKHQNQVSTKLGYINTQLELLFYLFHSKNYLNSQPPSFGVKRKELLELLDKLDKMQ